MDITRAKEIVSSLAEGVDPTTGEVFPAEHICNNPEIVRAFYTLLTAKSNSHNTNAVNAGKPWSLEDDKELEKMFIDGIPKKDIQQHFQRTSGSIQSRLVKLGLIEDGRKR